MAKKFILGTDCSFRNIGWAICNISKTRTKKLSVVSTGIEKINSKLDKKELKSIKDMRDSLLLAEKLSNVIDIAYDTASKNGAELIWAFEIPIGSQSARAARLLGISTGVIAGSIIEIRKYSQEYNPTTNIKVRTVKPTDVKNKVGNKKATKQQIINYVNKKYKNIGAYYPNCKFEHIADAIVIAEVALDKEKEKIDECIKI